MNETRCHIYLFTIVYEEFKLCKILLSFSMQLVTIYTLLKLNYVILCYYLNYIQVKIQNKNLITILYYYFYEKADTTP